MTTTSSRSQARSTLPRWLRLRLGLGHKLFLAFAAVAMMTLLASGTAWLAFDRVADRVDVLVDEAVPAMAGATDLSKRTALATDAAVALADAETEQDRAAVAKTLSQRIEALRDRLRSLAAGGVVGTATAQDEVAALEQESRKLDAQVAARLAAAKRREDLMQRMKQAHVRVTARLMPTLADAQSAMKASGETTIRDTRAAMTRLMEGEVLALQHGLTARALGQELTALIARSATAPDEAHLITLQDAFTVAGHQLDQAILALPETLEREELRLLSFLVADFGEGAGNVFALRRQELNLESLPPYQQAAVRAQREAVGQDIESVLTAFQAAVAPVTDNATFNLMIGGETVAADVEATLTSLIQDDVTLLQNLRAMLGLTDRLLGHLQTAAHEPTEAGLAAAERSFETTAAELRGLADGIGLDKNKEQLQEAVAAFIGPGTGRDGLFALRRSELAADEAGQALLVSTQAHAARLTNAVDGIVATARTDATEAATEASQAISTNKTILAILAGLAILITIAICWLFVGRSVMRRIAELARTTYAISQGDLDRTVHVSGRDELTCMAEAVAIFRDNSREMRRMSDERRLAREQQEQEKRALLEHLADDLRRNVGAVVHRLGEASGEMKTAAGAMSGVATETQEQATNVATGATEASANVQTVATAAEELSASIQDIGNQMERASGISGTALRQAETAQSKMASLNEAANRIDEVVKLINAIAGQTNLLALNATIEAARAGAAGKGFSVVASEVKNLADQTAKATHEISSHVQGIQTATRESTAVIEEVGRIIRQVHELGTAVAAAVEQQNAATSEIARNVQQAADGTDQVSRAIAEVTSAATRAGSASDQVLAAAEQLSIQTGALERHIEAFLSGLKAA